MVTIRTELENVGIPGARILLTLVIISVYYQSMVSKKTAPAKQLLKCISYTQRIDSARLAVASFTVWLILDH